MRPNFFHHNLLPTIPAEQSCRRYTLGAGGTAVFLMLVLAVTGVPEMFYYVPTPEMATLSIQTLSFLVPFGRRVRDLHCCWAVQLLLVVSAVFTGAPLILLSIIFPAPTASVITNITVISSDARAPWFFLWVQQMLKRGTPFLRGVLVSFAIQLVMALIPYILPQPTRHEAGRWFSIPNRVAQVVVAAIAFFIIL